MSIHTNYAGYTIGNGYGRINGASAAVTKTDGVDDAEAKTTEEAAAKSRADSYEPSDGTEKAYQSDTALVSQLKQELETHKLQFLNTVKDMLNKQGVKIAEGEGIWKQIAQGNFSVDEETSAAAREAISDGGYWSVEKTSERLVSYAKALTGGDPSKAEAMREAFVKGFQEAEKAWGGSLPEISQKTYDATMKLFDEWANEAE